MTDIEESPSRSEDTIGLSGRICHDALAYFAFSRPRHRPCVLALRAGHRSVATHASALAYGGKGAAAAGWNCGTGAWARGGIPAGDREALGCATGRDCGRGFQPHCEVSA